MMIDIEYLLLLQRFREMIHDALTPFMEWISLFAVTYLVLIPIMYYWTCNKKDGLYVMGAYCYTVAINAVVKLTACVYRPRFVNLRISAITIIHAITMNTVVGIGIPGITPPKYANLGSGTIGS